MAFPYLLLLVSGGHCQLLAVEGVGRYRRWGTTIDDAVGEAFDKTAKLLGLGYPGGPRVEAIAAEALEPERFRLPRPMVGRPGCDFSFSGLKTAVAPGGRGVCRRATSSAATFADLAAAFQGAVAASLTDRTAGAIARFRDSFDAPGTLVVAGGGGGQPHAARGVGGHGTRGGHGLRRAAGRAVRRQRGDWSPGRGSSACASAWPTRWTSRHAPAGRSTRRRPRRAARESRQ